MIFLALIFLASSHIIYSNHKLLNHELKVKICMFIGREESAEFYYALFSESGFDHKMAIARKHFVESE